MHSLVCCRREALWACSHGAKFRPGCSCKVSPERKRGCPADDEDEDEEEEDDKPKTKTVKETVWDWDLLNDNKALWLRSPSDVSEEEYLNFYKALAKVSLAQLLLTSCPIMTSPAQKNRSESVSGAEIVEA